jgi:hypothetical protein
MNCFLAPSNMIDTTWTADSWTDFAAVPYCQTGFLNSTAHGHGTTKTFSKYMSTGKIMSKKGFASDDQFSGTYNGDPSALGSWYWVFGVCTDALVNYSGRAYVDITYWTKFYTPLEINDI